jgi:hypothetical protein
MLIGWTKVKIAIINCSRLDERNQREHTGLSHYHEPAARDKEQL